jgi:hypothetical protein
MTAQTHKWLPSEPTNEMLDAVFALEEPNTLREYAAMWQAAPEVELKREPLSEVDIIVLKIKLREYDLVNQTSSDTALINFARAIEKAHGIT